MEKSNIILIDSSYTSFYRFFATKTWYSMANKEKYKKIKETGIENYDWLNDKIFIEKYEKMYLESIKKLVGKRVFNKSLIIFARDPKQKDIWRNKIMDNYKGKRQDLTLKNNFKPIFSYTYDILLPKWEKENDNILVFKESKIEADDIIAILAKYFRENYPDKKIYLVSGDEDFLQLGDENIYFAHYKKKKLFQLTKQEAAYKLIEKIINGDCSDNIEGIFKGKRVKEKKELIKSNEKLQKYLKENKDIKEKFIRNQKMIDFNYIPKKYEKKLINKFNKRINNL